MLIGMNGTQSKVLASCRRLGGTLAAWLLCVGASSCYGVNPVDLLGEPSPNSAPDSPSREVLGFEYEVYEVQGDAVSEVARNCEPLRADPTGPITGVGIGFAGAGDGTSTGYTVEYRFEGLTATASVNNTDINETVLSVEYDEEFLRSELEEESHAVLSSELSLILIGRGVPECEPLNDTVGLPSSVEPPPHG